jgi:hypothetical protein
VKAKTTGTATNDANATAQQRKKNFFGFGNVSNVGSGDYSNLNNNHHPNHEMPIYERTMIDMTPISIGNKTITIWPYDDYHLTQKLYFEHMINTMNKSRSGTNNNNNNSSNNNNSNENSSIPKDAATTLATQKAAAAKAYEQQQQQQQQQQQSSSSIPIFSRPPDPPDIPTAVQGLNLTVFESKAEERAIAIVSTYVYFSFFIRRGILLYKYMLFTHNTLFEFTFHSFL